MSTPLHEVHHKHTQTRNTLYLDCGCYCQAKPEELILQYCRLHGAAPYLLSACKELLTSGTYADNKDLQGVVARARIAVAIASAEGTN